MVLIDAGSTPAMPTIISKQKVMEELTIVRHNLMNDPNYRPYCGNDNHKGLNRVKWDSNLRQFRCSCGFVTEFPEDFIKRYTEKWGK